MEQNRESKNTGQGRLLLGDYVLVKQEKRNKWSMPYEPVFYIVHEINGSRITAKRATDERTICRDINHFKLVNAVINSADDREITEAGELSTAADPSPGKFTSFPRYVDKPSIPLWKDGVDQLPEVVGIFVYVGLKKTPRHVTGNPGKCKELTMRKKGFVEELCKIHNIPQGSELKLLGVIYHYNYKYASHEREKLVKANKCLHVIRTLRQERYNQGELDYLLQSIVMPNFLYGLSLYGASSSNLNNVQHFLNKCYKRRYISRKLNMREPLERSDCRIFRTALRTNSPLVKILPERNFTNYALRKPCFYHPIVVTERFKSSYVNRLIFSYNIDSLM